jgi:UDP-N-acetylmuramate dehydrogenase
LFAELDAFSPPLAKAPPLVQAIAMSGTVIPLPTARGTLTPDRPMADLTWLRVGGPADWLFQPADTDDLTAFLAALDPGVPVFPMGVGSNLIVRDGGIAGLVIRVGRGFNGVRVEDDRVVAGAAALDAHVARRAAEAGIDLTFLRTIPGTVGGAAKMNAGCYGTYVADAFVSARAVTRQGEARELTAADMGFAYRSTALPAGVVITEVTLVGPRAEPAALEARMAEQIARRDASQPTRDRSAGSTFRNPAGFSSTGRGDHGQELMAWKLIEDAGLRGATLGRAQMSPMHANFLVNTGGATAAELEGLGELVRKTVWESTNITLEWEIMRIGRPDPA